MICGGDLIDFTPKEKPYIGKLVAYIKQSAETVNSVSTRGASARINTLVTKLKSLNNPIVDTIMEVFVGALYAGDEHALDGALVRVTGYLNDSICIMCLRRCISIVKEKPKLLIDFNKS